MNHFDKVRNLANMAFMFVEDIYADGGEYFRIESTDDGAGYFIVISESGDVYSINYEDVDLNKGRFYALTELN